MKKRILAFALMTVVAFSAFTGCTSTEKEEPVQVEETTETEETETSEETSNTEEIIEEKEIMNIGLLKGPTAIGATLLMNEVENGVVFGDYGFEIFTAPDEVTGKILSGELDVAAVPVNLASVLYNKSEGEILIAALNTLGTLYLVEQGSSVKDISDLSGKTVVMAGQGSVPEYVFQFILNEAGVTDCTVEFVPSHGEAVAALTSGKATVALLPEPFATSVVEKNAEMKVAIDLAKEWDVYSYEEEDVPNTLTMGCIVVRKEYLEENQKSFNKFLDEYEYFVETAVEDPTYTAEFVVKYGIVDDIDIAEKAIPNCNIMYIEGGKMLRLVENFCSIMYEANPKSIGGSMPDEDFYYVRKY